MQSALAGSWHNNGFYGHYRSQFKSESAGEYRLAAKPQPPAVFLQRCQEPARQHFFSKHDNRSSFDKETAHSSNRGTSVLVSSTSLPDNVQTSCGPLNFWGFTLEWKGIGRRKDLERLWRQHTFLRWAPRELELHQQGPLESSYQADFRSGPGLGGLPQRLVHFVQIQPPRASTTYQQNFCQPSRGGHCGSNKIGPQALVTDMLPHLPGIPRPKLLQHYLHAGVSECLNWSKTLNKDS